MWLKLLLAGICALPVFAQTLSQDETLRYNVNWPSGLSLGEAVLTAHRTSSGWDLEMTVDAGIPGVRITDRFHSATRADGCSLQLNRDMSFGSRKTKDETTFDYDKGIAKRTTPDGGGSTDISITSHCSSDALAFVYLARQALAHGGLPPSQQVFFGALYSVALKYMGEQNVTVAGKAAVADRVTVSIKGPASNNTAEIFFARDAARTPLLVHIPTGLGTIALELTR